MRGSKGAVLATVAAGLLWGSSFAVVKIGLRSIDPFWFVFLRFAAASVLVILIVALTGRTHRVLALLRNPLVLWLGVTNAAGFVFQFKGQTMTTAANAALLINASTLFVAADFNLWVAFLVKRFPPNLRVFFRAVVLRALRAMWILLSNCSLFSRSLRYSKYDVNRLSRLSAFNARNKRKSRFSVKDCFVPSFS